MDFGSVLRPSQDGVSITVHVVPRASRDALADVHGDALRVRLRAPPVEGAANAALIAFLASLLGVPHHRVQILSGHSARQKRVHVSGLTLEQAEQRLERLLNQPPPAPR